MRFPSLHAAAALSLGLSFVPLSASEAPAEPRLVFKTGFEGDTRVVPAGGSDHKMVGTDPAPPNQSDVHRDLGIKNFTLQYTGGDDSKRYAKIIPEPGRPTNQVLQFWLNDSWPASENQVKARVQANIYGRDGVRDFYQSVRVFLTDDWRALRDYPRPIKWLTISEFWNDIFWGGKNGARVTLGIGKPTGTRSDLYFILDSQGPGTKHIWEVINKRVPVPIGRWFTMEYYYQEGDAETGRFYLAITPDGGRRQVVFDVTGWTHCPTNATPDGITDWNPLKLYTSKEVVGFMKERGKTLEIYWDDFELWHNRKPTDSKPSPPST